MRTRNGFTAIELAVVMGIIALLSGMALPVVSSTLRRGSLNSSANIIVEAWRKARSLALAHPLPATAPGDMPRHFGVLIRKRGDAYDVSLVFAARHASALASDPDDALLRSDAEVQDNSPGTPAGSAAFRERLPNSIAVVADSGGAPLAGALVVYAQYRTGLPIAAEDVVAGRGPVAGSRSVGLAPVTLNTAAIPGIDPQAATIAPLLRVQSTDYDPVKRRGRACAVAIFHAGITAITDL